MDDMSLHERMEAYETLASEAAEAARKREETATDFGTRLAATITDAVEQDGANVEVTAQSTDGLIESVPTRERVLARAVELGLDEEGATSR